MRGRAVLGKPCCRSLAQSMSAQFSESRLVATSPKPSAEARRRERPALLGYEKGHSGRSNVEDSLELSNHRNVRQCVDVARGLVLLFGIGIRGPSLMGSEDEAEQSIGRPCRQTNGRSKRTCELTSSIVPRGTSFHRSVEFEFPPIGLDAARFHAAVVACSRVQRNSVPSTHMRCIITANRRGQGRDRLFHPATPGDLHRPGFEPGPLRSDPSPSST